LVRIQTGAEVNIAHAGRDHRIERLRPVSDVADRNGPVLRFRSREDTRKLVPSLSQNLIEADVPPGEWPVERGPHLRLIELRIAPAAHVRLERFAPLDFVVPHELVDIALSAGTPVAIDLRIVIFYEFTDTLDKDPLVKVVCRVVAIGLDAK
jgi:hypothetical protein